MSDMIEQTQFKVSTVNQLKSTTVYNYPHMFSQSTVTSELRLNLLHKLQWLSYIVS